MAGALGDKRAAHRLLGPGHSALQVPGSVVHAFIDSLQAPRHPVECTQALDPSAFIERSDFEPTSLAGTHTWNARSNFTPLFTFDERSDALKKSLLASSLHSTGGWSHSDAQLLLSLSIHADPDTLLNPTAESAASSSRNTSHQGQAEFGTQRHIIGHSIAASQAAGFRPPTPSCRDDETSLVLRYLSPHRRRRSRFADLTQTYSSSASPLDSPAPACGTPNRACSPYLGDSSSSGSSGLHAGHLFSGHLDAQLDAVMRSEPACAHGHADGLHSSAPGIPSRAARRGSGNFPHGTHHGPAPHSTLHSPHHSLGPAGANTPCLSTARLSMDPFPSSSSSILRPRAATTSQMDEGKEAAGAAGGSCSVLGGRRSMVGSSSHSLGSSSSSSSSGSGGSSHRLRGGGVMDRAEAKQAAVGGNGGRLCMRAPAEDALSSFMQGMRLGGATPTQHMG